MSVVFFLEFRHMESDWAGLPGFLLTLPLSSLVVGLYFLASYAAEFRGYNIHVTDYHAEFGFILCAFLNAFIFYLILATAKAQGTHLATKDKKMIEAAQRIGVETK